MPFFLRSLGWKTLAADVYADAWQRYGGGIITHPHILSFIHQRCGCKPTFLGKTDRYGNIIAAMAVWGKYLAGDKTALKQLGIERRYDFGSPEILIPFSPSFRGVIGFRSKFASSLHATQIVNSTTRQRTAYLCLAKGLGPNGMSSRSCQRRRTQVRQLLKAGGTLHNIVDYTPHQAADIFTALFEKRWGKPYHTSVWIHDYFTALWPHITGKLILMHGEPAAYQLLLTAQSDRYFTVDYINSGVTPEYKSLSLGSALTWLNIVNAWDQANHHHLELRYSFGRNSYNYKAQWANEIPYSRILTL